MSDAENPGTDISIGNTEYNGLILVSEEEYDSIRNALMREIATNLMGALAVAISDFNANREPGREEKIAIFSSCADKSNVDEIPTDDDVCNEYGDGIFDED